MKKTINFIIFMIILIFTLSSSVSSNGQNGNEGNMIDGWSSIDNVFYNLEENLLTIKPGSGPIKIGSSAREVQEVMGIPDDIDQVEHIYLYRNSPIFFNSDWKVKSWDNRNGNLKVLPEKEEVKLGDHIQKVFQQKGFPIAIKKDYSSYRLKYLNQIIYLNNQWLVEAIQNTTGSVNNGDNTGKSLEDYIKDFESYLGRID
jgi:hypothetical protein